MPWKWFGVKTLVRWEAIGKPKSIDDNYYDEATLFEERIVSIKHEILMKQLRKAKKKLKKIYLNTKTFTVKR